MPSNSSDNDVIRTPEMPSDPPGTAGERDMLVSYLDYYRAVLARKCADLGADQLRVSAAASSLTLGGLLRHMALVEDFWFGETLHGSAPADEWADADWEASPDWEMDTAADFAPAELGRQFDDAVARSRSAIDGVGLDRLAASPGRRGPTNLRWIMVHMIEEYARHCGHADLIRESIDGHTGD